jgi:hypothetical protein
MILPSAGVLITAITAIIEIEIAYNLYFVDWDGKIKVAIS